MAQAGEQSNPYDEITEAENVEIARNKELVQCITQLVQDNEQYKNHQKVFLRKRAVLIKELEKCAGIYYELYRETRDLLEMVINSSVGPEFSNKQPAASPAKSVQVEPLKKTPQSGPSVLTRRCENVHTEQLPQRYSEPGPSGITKRKSLSNKNEELSTIAEEKLAEISTQAVMVQKELCVRLSRLPEHRIVEHMAREANISGEPVFTSTPLKLETMKGLGLYPSPSPQQFPREQFFTFRKRAHTKVETDDSDKKEQEVPCEGPKTAKVKGKTKKKLKPQEETVGRSRRPSRKAKPVRELREPSLNRKLRRE